MLLPELKKIFAGCAATALVMVSLAVICTKQLVATFGFENTPHEMSNMAMSDCVTTGGSDSQICQMFIAVHMSTFFQAFPASISNSFLAFLTLWLAILGIWIKETPTISRDLDLWRVKLKNFMRRLPRSCALYFFIFAFSRGTLNAKRYAS